MVMLDSVSKLSKIETWHIIHDLAVDNGFSRNSAVRWADMSYLPAGDMLAEFYRLTRLG